MPPATPPDKPAIKTIEDLLKGTYWEKFSGDKAFIEAVHAYYVSLKLQRERCLPGSTHFNDDSKQLDRQDEFYIAAREEVAYEVQRVQENLPDTATAEDPDKKKAYYHPL